MDTKKLIKVLGFKPKEGTSGIYHKKYNGYSIEVDLEKKTFNFGGEIKFGDSNKSVQNIVKPEDWVVLECVDRLLIKGYQPKNITLEKTWKTGHGTSGRLDIFVSRNDGSAYLMIECKTWGTEFDKELKNLEKNGGQLFTYFQQDKDADILMLYSSLLEGKEITYRNEIVKIESDCRQAGNVKDFYDRWNKLPKSNGIFDAWSTPYEFHSKALTKNDLKVLKQEDSSFIFNRFLEILRHNVVSDKPNAFNKIFTLFLCKIVDENRDDNDQLHFQWLEGEDNHISFQKRLTDLYRRGMKELLEKKVTDISDDEFDTRFQQVEENYRDEIKDILTEIRLKKNNEFAIKEVFDDISFTDNAKVVKEVVELLQVYQIRYNYRQQFLSDFFELLLTTGLKQESGQFFTPVPIARFIIRSLPLREITKNKIEQGNKKDLLPLIIDYAAGSGHFLTESMEEVQKCIDNLNLKDYKPQTRKQLDGFQRVQFDWAEDYVYGIEKDYRLVKTAKVSCYLHGDGLAKVIHGDGLGDFSSSTEFKDLLVETDKTYPQDNKQFDVIISNPPYSVAAFKGLMDREKSEIGFDLFDRLTDQSSEIECLFIERTKQLLKDGGVAGIILPSSTLSNTGIYTQTREILLKYFELLAIVELGSNTFMATGTNTVTLFLRRRNNAESINIKKAVQKSFADKRDVTINSIEKPISKYVTHVWDSITIDDYITLLEKQPNSNIKEHEIFQEYKNKVKANNDEDLLDRILEIEQDKMLYYIIALPQELVLIKTGEKTAEKQFLGYEFSNRRGSEGIHPIKRSKSIDECTSLYDSNSFTNPLKASTYIYKAFNNELGLEVPEILQKNVSYQNLVDLLTFDRVDFEKNINLIAKKKVTIESKWNQVKLGKLATLIKRGKSAKYGNSKIQIIKSGQARGLREFDFTERYFVADNFKLDERKLEKGDLLINSSGVGTAGRVTLFNLDGTFVADSHITILRVDKNQILPAFALACFAKIGFKTLESLALGQSGQIEMTISTIENIKLPIPPLKIQRKIISKIDALEQKEFRVSKSIEELRKTILDIVQDLDSHPKYFLKSLSENWDNKRQPVTKSDRENGIIPYYGASGIVDYVANYLIDDTVLLISEDGANLKSRVYPIAFTASGKIWVNNHAHILKFKDSVTHKLAELYINQLDISEFITGQAQPKLNQKNLNNIKIPLPPLKEQKKLVAKIEKLESKIGELEKQLNIFMVSKESELMKQLG